MKKESKLASKKVIFQCLSCKKEYSSYWVTEKNEDWIERISSCSNCCPFYKGVSASEIKVGSVEKFRERIQKLKR